MMPFRTCVLFIAGDWHKAKESIDEELYYINDSTKASDVVFEAIRRSGFDDDTCLGITIYDQETRTIIIVTRSRYPSIGTITHECLHATMDVVDRVGVKDSNHETEAYLLEGLVEECVKTVNKK